jgi:hypothetical protein
VWVGLISSALGVLAIPPRLALAGVHRLATGRRAILDVTVDREGGLVARARLRTGLLRSAADPGVVGVLLRLRAPPGGWATCQDLRAAVQHLRQRGKREIGRAHV